MHDHAHASSGQATSVVPPIPAHLAHLRRSAGLVVPWITPRRGNGQDLFGAIDRARAEHAIRRYLCGVCGNPLRDNADRSPPTRMVLLMRGSDLALRCMVEPALHPQCAAYTARACPMVAGRSSHYRRSPHPFDDTMVVGGDLERRLGAPAESWFAVWLAEYEIGVRDGFTVASYQRIEPLRIRPTGRAGALLGLLLQSLPETSGSETGPRRQEP